MRDFKSATDWAQLGDNANQLASLAKPQVFRAGNREKTQRLAEPIIYFCGAASIQKMIENAGLQTSVKMQKEASIDDICNSIKGRSSNTPVIVFIDAFELRGCDTSQITGLLGDFPIGRVNVLSEVNLQRSNRLEIKPGTPVRFIHLPKELVQISNEIAHFVQLIDWLETFLVQAPKLDDLNARELRLARLVAFGCPNKRSAKLLGLAEKTIEKCRAKVYSKLSVHSTAELTSLIIMRDFFRWPSLLSPKPQTEADGNRSDY